MMLENQDLHQGQHLLCYYPHYTHLLCCWVLICKEFRVTTSSEKSTFQKGRLQILVLFDKVEEKAIANVFMWVQYYRIYMEAKRLFLKASETLIVFTIHNDVLLCIQCIEGWYFRFSDSTKMPHSTHHPKDVFYVFRKVVSWDRTLSLIGRKDFRKCDVFKM